jgi:hypothetical protein
MDWRRLGDVFNAWAMAVAGKHSVYVEERKGEWFAYFAVSRSKGLMLAEISVQERVSGEELEGVADAGAFGRAMAARMAGELAKL